MFAEYNTLMRLARKGVLAASALAPDESMAKFMRFGRGQREVLGHIAAECEGLDCSRPTVWLHAASLGEFGIARPVVKALRDAVDCNIVVTFFSPTGYEALSRRPDPNIDRVFYLPLDTRENARKFLDIVKPDCVVFMVSEYWHNYLDELQLRSIPAVLVSAVIRRNSPFFRWYGRIYRHSLGAFRRIFTLDRASLENLRQLGVETGVLNGDPLFDNVALVASTPWNDEVVERFLGGRRAFIAGSIHPDKDLELTADLANRHPDIPFIIVPHEITTDILSSIRHKVRGEVKFYSECGPDTDFSTVRALVIDHVGALAYLYRYAAWAYVGGGFTKRLLHSVIEPVAYGIPVAFGPNIGRKTTPAELIRIGVGRSVTDIDQLDSWLRHLKGDPAREAYLAKRAAKYMNDNVNATRRVTDTLREILCAKN